MATQFAAVAIGRGVSRCLSILCQPLITFNILHAQAFFGTAQVSQYHEGKTSLDFTEARDTDWQWHQLGHMQVCTLLQTDNHTGTPPLSSFAGQMPFLPPNVKPLKALGCSKIAHCQDRLERGADCLDMVQLMPLHPRSPSSLASFKSRLVLPFWCWLVVSVMCKCSSKCYGTPRVWTCSSVAEWLARWTQAQKGLG